jgi:hypothetical protein
MKPNITLAAMSLALITLFTSPALAADAPKPVTGQTPDADVILRQMSSRLGAARRFSFEARREINPSLLAGANLPPKADIEVSVLRPNKIMSKSTSQGNARNFYADGRNLSEFDVTKNLYATVPMHTSIDGLAVQMQEKYGFTLPLLELANSNIYQDIRRQAHSVSYIGRSNYSTGFLGSNSSECDRVALSGKLVDAEIWVGASDRLPRRLIFTFKNRPRRPQVQFDFSNWNLAAPVSDRNFVFVPPAGAVKVPMMTDAQIKSAVKQAKDETALITTDSQSITLGWVAARGYGGRGFVAAGRGYGYGAVAVRGGYYGGVARLPAGYYGALPGAYRAVYYGGYHCYYAGGVYYRPVFYQGNTVYIVVR